MHRLRRRDRAPRVPARASRSGHPTGRRSRVGHGSAPVGSALRLHRSAQARVPRLDPAGRRHRRDGRLPGRARGRRDRRGRRARDARTARLMVRARLQRLLRPARDEPAPVLHPHPPAETSSGAARSVGRAARAPVRGRLAGPHQPARGARARRAGDRAPGSGRHAHPAPGPAGRAQARAVEVRDRRDALTGLGARDRRVRLPLRRGGAHARRSGPAAARGRPRHELASAPAPGVRADPDGWVVRARVAGTGDEQVRAVPVPVSARGDAAGAAPGPRRRGPGAAPMLSRSRGSSARCRSRATAARSRGGYRGGHAAGRGDPGCRWPS